MPNVRCARRSQKISGQQTTSDFSLELLVPVNDRRMLVLLRVPEIAQPPVFEQRRAEIGAGRVLALLRDAIRPAEQRASPEINSLRVFPKGARRSRRRGRARLCFQTLSPHSLLFHRGPFRLCTANCVDRMNTAGGPLWPLPLCASCAQISSSARPRLP